MSFSPGPCFPVSKTKTSFSRSPNRLFFLRSNSMHRIRVYENVHIHLSGLKTYRRRRQGCFTDLRARFLVCCSFSKQNDGALQGSAGQGIGSIHHQIMGVISSGMWEEFDNSGDLCEHKFGNRLEQNRTPV